MSASKRDIGSDLDKVDAHVIAPEEYLDAPELDDAFFERAVFEVNGVERPKPMRRGRPKADHPKIAVKLRLDPDVLEGFRASGPGWQTRINAALREALAARR
jgi:uncharacterized protein (DUF4415 family)